MEQIREAIDILVKIGAPYDQLLSLSSEELNLRSDPDAQRELNCPIGYSGQAKWDWSRLPSRSEARLAERHITPTVPWVRTKALLWSRRGSHWSNTSVDRKSLW